MAEREVVLGLAAEIVSAHVSNNTVPVDQLTGLIQQVFNTLASVERASVTPPKPEVQVRLGDWLFVLIGAGLMVGSGPDPPRLLMTL